VVSAPRCITSRQPTSNKISSLLLSELPDWTLWSTLSGFGNIFYRWQMVGLSDRIGSSVAVAIPSYVASFPHRDLQENNKPKKELPIQ
jgi:hypothetical protein